MLGFQLFSLLPNKIELITPCLIYITINSIPMFLQELDWLILEYLPNNDFMNMRAVSKDLFNLISNIDMNSTRVITLCNAHFSVNCNGISRNCVCYCISDLAYIKNVLFDAKLTRYDRGPMDKYAGVRLQEWFSRIDSMTNLKKLEIGRTVSVVDNIIKLTQLQHLIVRTHMKSVYWDTFNSVVKLELWGRNCISSQELGRLTNITSLKVMDDCSINFGISCLTGLRRLTLGKDLFVSVNNMSKMESITKLVLLSRFITNKGISHLTGIKKLQLGRWCTITDDGICNLTNICSLNLKRNKFVTDVGISKLTNIVELCLDKSGGITSSGLLGLTNLTSLDLSRNKVVDCMLSRLSGLVELKLNGRTRIDNCYLMGLTNITHLELAHNKKVTNSVLLQMSNVRVLNLRGDNRITDAGLSRMSNLVHLSRGNNYRISDSVVESMKHVERDTL